MATFAIDPRLGAHAADFVSTQQQMLIDGKFVAASAGKTFAVFNPATAKRSARSPRPTTSTSISPSAPPAAPSTPDPGPP